MARRWTPQRFVMLRRIRVAVCVVTVLAACVATFAFTARKSVALTVNGKTTNVETYAMSVDRLLEEQGVDVKTHDLVQSSSGGTLANHAVVTVRSAYQTTVNVDGEEIPFWTVADSADQLIGFFKANEQEASKITVDIDNIYNQLTGGLVINKEGPVTVIADGKSSEAPNGKLPAASILDSKGINVGKEDRVSVEEDGDQTILRVKRVTHGQETRTKSVPYATRTIIDSSLESGQTVVRQEGQNGEVTQVYDVTYVDGVAESETLASETTTKIAVDQVIAVGPEKVEEPKKDTGNGKADAGTNKSDKDDSSSKNDSSDKDDSSSKDDSSDKDDSGNSGNNGSNGNDSGNSNNTGNSGNSGNSNNNSGNNGSSNNNSGNSGNSNNSGGSSSGSGRLWHPSVAQAQTYAAAAAAQRGWTGAEWDALAWLWNKESGWRWNADNPYSDAYGIPQALPGSKMGVGWQDDGAVQIDWGLSYIAQRYGSPTNCKRIWEQQGWY
ncbi:G5 domain-containing protein [Bifidobacterium aesculapii]|uniref:aggregation-promoting factor C-terminal-like domain-containing protein n=1 Tax=Bifidobacterium aesculapii TaxID=1329411 RepID=UPI0006E30CC0|nr:G5 domain-containing protein [Bifidobacterium aesculapii]